MFLYMNILKNTITTQFSFEHKMHQMVNVCQKEWHGLAINYGLLLKFILFSHSHMVIHQHCKAMEIFIPKAEPWPPLDLWDFHGCGCLGTLQAVYSVCRDDWTTDPGSMIFPPITRVISEVYAVVLWLSWVWLSRYLTGSSFRLQGWWDYWLQDFIFVLRGKENLLAVTQMTDTHIHNGPDTDARHTPSLPPPPPPQHTHTRKHVSTPVCRCEDISTTYHRLRTKWSAMGEQRNTTWKMQLGQDTQYRSREKVVLLTEWQMHSHANSHKRTHKHIHRHRHTHAQSHTRTPTSGNTCPPPHALTHSPT